MLLKVAGRMLLQDWVKYLGALLGVALAVYLVVLQAGFYFGFRRDITKVIDMVGADLWIAPKGLMSFDYAVYMDDFVSWKARSQPGVDAAARVVFTFAFWRQPARGVKESVQVLGVDLGAGVPIDFGREIPGAASLLSGPGSVLVDQRDFDRLGIERLEEEGTEILDHRVRVVGLLRDKHLFSTSCLVVTDLDNGRTLLGAPPSKAHFVAVRCKEGATVGAVRARLAKALPEYAVLSVEELRGMSRAYWEEQTGVGPVLSLSAALAAVVGLLSVTTTFYILTIENTPVIAAMKAMGAFAWEIAAILLVQIVIVFAIGCAVAGAAAFVTVRILSTTRIAVEVTPALVASAMIGLFALCALASSISIRRLVGVDPGEAFRS